MLKTTFFIRAYMEVEGLFEETYPSSSCAFGDMYKTELVVWVEWSYAV